MVKTAADGFTKEEAERRHWLIIEFAMLTKGEMNPLEAVPRIRQQLAANDFCPSVLSVTGSLNKQEIEEILDACYAQAPKPDIF